MLGRLEARLAREGTEGVRTALMDGQQLDLADASFDVTCSAFGLMFFPDRARGLREMRRVLRPGGRAAIVVWNRVDQLAPHVHFVKALMAAVPGYALPENPPSWLEIQNPERLAQELEQAGFADVAVHTVTENWHVSSAQLLWENLHGISPAMTEITDGLSSEVLEKAGRAFIESFTEEFGAGETDMPVEGLVGLGIKATQNGAGPEEA
jgi:SAM-dependent methyltransferase